MNSIYSKIVFIAHIIVLLGFTCALSQDISLHKNNDGLCPRELPHTSLMVPMENKCFQFVDKEEYWTGARDYCRDNGGKLIKLEDKTTSDFIIKTLDGIDEWDNNGVWIGLHDRGDELEWKWVTEDRDISESLNTEWTNWGKGHPEGWGHSGRDCVRMVRNKKWTWHETVCSAFYWQYRFICEYEIPKQEEIPHAEMAGQYMLKITETEAESTTEIDDTQFDSGLNYDDENNDVPAPAVGQLTGTDGRSSLRILRIARPLIILAASSAVVCFIVAVVLISIRRRRKSKTSEDKDNMKNSATVEHQYSKICTEDSVCKEAKFKENRDNNIYVDPPYPKLVSSKTENEILNLKTDPFQLSRRELPLPEVPTTLVVPKVAEPLSQVLLPSPEGGTSVSNACYVMPNPQTPTIEDYGNSRDKYENVDQAFGAYANEVNANGRSSQSGSEYMPMDNVSDIGSKSSSAEKIDTEDHIYSDIDNEYESLDDIKRPTNC